MHSSSYSSRGRSKNCLSFVMQDKQNKKERKQKLFWGILTAIVTLIVLVIYRFSLNFSFFPYVMWGYMIILTVLVIWYILYNRGFTRRGVEVDMLPDDWDEERRIEFVEDGKRRLVKSKWILMLIISFLFTFLFDAFDLFVLSGI